MLFLKYLNCFSGDTRGVFSNDPKSEFSDILQTSFTKCPQRISGVRAMRSREVVMKAPGSRHGKVLEERVPEAEVP